LGLYSTVTRSFSEPFGFIFYFWNRVLLKRTKRNRRRLRIERKSPVSSGVEVKSGTGDEFPPSKPSTSGLFILELLSEQYMEYQID
jgi:hypothetical protein